MKNFKLGDVIKFLPTLMRKEGVGGKTKNSTTQQQRRVSPLSPPTSTKMMQSPRSRPRVDKPVAVPESPLDKWMNASGKEVEAVGSSHCDEGMYPAMAVLDGSHNSFWMPTGMYPQELIIGFKEEVKISEIKTTTRNVRTMTIDRIIPNQPLTATGNPARKEVSKKDLMDTKGKMQVEVHSMNNVSVRFLRLVIQSSFDHFVAVFSVRVQTADGKWIC